MGKSNEALFTSLHVQYYPMVMQLSTGFMKGDVDQAKDLSQDVFINIWNALDKFKGASSYKTWIYRITVNTCLNYLRDRKDRGKLSIDESVRQIPMKINADDDSSARLYGAIGKLNEMDRLIIMMVLDELDYDEIASIVGISSVNLRVRIHRIKKELKEIL